MKLFKKINDSNNNDIESSSNSSSSFHEYNNHITPEKVKLQNKLSFRFRSSKIDSIHYDQESFIKKDDKKKNQFKWFNLPHFSLHFSKCVQYSLRCALAAVIAGIFQSIDGGSHLVEDKTVTRHSKISIFPSFYYLGGLTYSVTTVLVTSGRSLGETLQNIWHTAAGLSVALIVTLIQFALVSFSYDTDPYVVNISFTGSKYYVMVKAFYKYLPFMIILTFILFMSPLHTNTKKLAIAMYLYFGLTILNPLDPINPGNSSSYPGNLKNRKIFNTGLIFKNFGVYCMIGVAGWIFSILSLILPYPLLALRQVHKEIISSKNDLKRIFNLIMDSYCFREKKPSDIKFQIDEYFSIARKRSEYIEDLISNCWWEQLIGLHYFSSVHLPLAFQYLVYYNNVLSDLQSLHLAASSTNMKPTEFLFPLQTEFYLFQKRVNLLLDEIHYQLGIHMTKQLQLKNLTGLKKRICKIKESHEKLVLENFKRTEFFINDQPDLEEKDAYLGFFVFSLESLTENFFLFEKRFNQKSFSAVLRVKKFIKKNVKSALNLNQYTWNKMATTLKSVILVVIGTYVAVYLYGYSSTIPTTLAYTTGTNLGGSFSTTFKRISSIAVGSILPSAFSFYLCYICDPLLHGIFINIFFFFWVFISMYVYFNGDIGSKIAVGSACIAAGIFLNPCSCTSNNDVITPFAGTYDSLKQNSFAMIIYIVVEFLILPQNSLLLVRQNIQQILQYSRDVISFSFSYHISYEKMSLEDEKNIKEENRRYVDKTLPSLLKKQEELLNEVKYEPMLWKTDIPERGYRQLTKYLLDLSNKIYLIYNLVNFYDMQGLALNYGGFDADDVEFIIERDSNDGRIDKDANENISKPFYLNMQFKAREKWIATCNEFLSSLGQTFDLLINLFCSDHLYLTNEETSYILLLKEGFHFYDKTEEGEISLNDSTELIEKMLLKLGKTVTKDTGYKIEKEIRKKISPRECERVSFKELYEVVKKSTIMHSIETKHGLNGAKQERNEYINSSFSTLSEERFMNHRIYLLKSDNHILQDKLKEMKRLYIDGVSRETHTRGQVYLVQCLLCAADGILKNLIEIEQLLTAY